MQTNDPTTADRSLFAANVQRLRENGLRDADIARKLGVEKSTLDKRMKEHRRQERRR